MDKNLKTIMGASIVTGVISATGFFYNFGYALCESVYQKDNYSLLTPQQNIDAHARINGYKSAAIPFGVVAAISSVILMKGGEKRLEQLEAESE
jgi:hypothetical protein